MPSAKNKDKSVLGRLASELDNHLSMTEAVDFPEGPKDWELDTEAKWSRMAAEDLTKAAKRAQAYITKEVKKAGKMGEDDAIALTLRAKKEFCMPIHRFHREYGAMERPSIDVLDSFLADVAGDQTGLNATSIYLSL
jgi:hypothetical protein